VSLFAILVHGRPIYPANVRDDGFHSNFFANFFTAIEPRCFRIDTDYQILVIVSIKIGLIAQSLLSYLTRASLRDPVAESNNG
jgi:hypothetical protein